MLTRLLIAVAIAELIIIAAVFLTLPIHLGSVTVLSVGSPFVTLPDPPYVLDWEDQWKSDCGDGSAFHVYPTGCKQREVNVI